MAPEDGEIHGGEELEAELPENQEEGSEIQNEEQEQQEEQPETPPEKKSDPTAELVALLREQAEEKKRASAPAPKQLTPDELEEKFGRVKLTAEDLASIGFLEASPEQVRGMQNLFDKLATYILNKSGHTVDERFSAAEKEYSPIRQAYIQQQYKAHQDTFYSRFPHLKGKEELVGLVAQSLKNDPATSSLPPDKLYEVLNSHTLALLKKHGITTSAQPAPKKAVPKPNTLSTSGGSTETKPKSETPTNPQLAAALRLRS